ncbi:MAG: hypothetical protein ACJ72D_09315 [Marmoricola sp.]
MSTSEHGVHLRRSAPNTAAVAALGGRSAGPGGLAGVLADLNRHGVPARPPGLLVDHGFGWNEQDASSPRWWPQGITTSADAADDGLVDGRRLAITSWYSHVVDGSNHGSRITVVDLDTLAYRHVLLVTPRLVDAKVHLDPLLVHAGGIVWHGPHLFVAGTRRGLVTCRLEDITRVEPGPDTFDHRYVLPVRFSYDAVSDHGTEQLRYSFLSLDRRSDPPCLVAGEYAAGDMTQRLVRYRFDPTTSSLHETGDGTAFPLDLDRRGVGHMQGAAVVDGTYYVTSSRGRWRLGSVFVGTPGDFRELEHAVPNGPEDLSYDPSEDAFWSLSEYPGRRYVFRFARPPARPATRPASAV